MRVLALDIGEKRVGCAVASTQHAIAFPVCVLDAAEVTAHGRALRNLLADEEPDLILAGRPLTLAGEVGPQAERVEAVARDIAAFAGLPLHFVDERLSSAEAKRILAEQGLNQKQMRGKVDSLAASLFLQAWLDSHAEL